MSGIEDIEKAIEAVDNVLPYMAAQHLLNLCKDIRWENNPITTEIKDNMENNEVDFLIETETNEQMSYYAELLSKAGYELYYHKREWHIIVKTAKQIFEITEIIKENIIITSEQFDDKHLPKIEIDNDYKICTKSLH